jgi:hypothetical protein
MTIDWLQQTTAHRPKAIAAIKASASSRKALRQCLDSQRTTPGTIRLAAVSTQDVEIIFAPNAASLSKGEP